MQIGLLFGPYRIYVRIILTAVALIDLRLIAKDDYRRSYLVVITSE